MKTLENQQVQDVFLPSIVENKSESYNISYIEKRNGVFVIFDIEKIKIAVSKSIKSTFDNMFEINEILNKIMGNVITALNQINNSYLFIEDVQDIVISSILTAGYKNIADSYSTYRSKKAEERKSFDTRVLKLIDQYLERDTWEIKENANMSYSLQGLNLYLTAKLSKTYWLNKIFDENDSKHHFNGDIHIHDLYNLAAYCCGWDLKELLHKGFTGCPGKLSCDPPKHFDAAIGQIYNFLYTTSGEVAGAVAFSNVDTLLAPYIRKDNLTNNRSKLKQSIQNLIYNLNVPTRVGFQCLSEDTEVLTDSGWKFYSATDITDQIVTMNMETRLIETLPMTQLCVYRHTGIMYNYKSANVDQLVNGEHKCVVHDIDTNQYKFTFAKDLYKDIYNSQLSELLPYGIVDPGDDTIITEILNEEVTEMTIKFDYDGIIWCPSTENGTVIARRNGKVFITGNSPFTNFSFDLTCPEHMRDEPVFIGNKDTLTTYSEYQKEIDMFNDVFCEVMSEGDKDNKIFTFPIPTYEIDENFDWDNSNLDNLWKMTGKYGIPYFGNYLSTGLDKEDFTSMCCRLSIDTNTLNKRGGGLFGSASLVGSLGVITINMPRIGHLAKDKSEFFDRLDELLITSKNLLIMKSEFIEEQTKQGLYPYSKFFLESIYQRFGRYWANHFLTIGIIGVNEACINLLGKSIEDSKSHDFAKEILDFINIRLIEFQKDTDQLFNLEASPSEGTSYDLWCMDQKLYPEMECFKENTNMFYTNSTFLPVDSKLNLFEALSHQEVLQEKYTGGTVFHGYLGENIDNIQVIKNIVRIVLTNYKVPYFSITPTFSICDEHGYNKGNQPKCTTCGKETSIYSRVVGYFRPIDNWNDGKVDEFSKRTLYDKDMISL